MTDVRKDILDLEMLLKYSRASLDSWTINFIENMVSMKDLTTIRLTERQHEKVQEILGKRPKQFYLPDDEDTP